MSKLTKQQAAEAYWSSIDAERNLVCPVRTTLNVLGGKWKLLILSYLLDEPRRYGELRRLVPEITEKMLIQELRELETDGIVARTVHQTVPPRVDYSLTGQGQRVRPVFAELLGWGKQYLDRAGSGPLPETPATTVGIG
jgi:DNA-binding HxlR family transcriptional regulator